MSFGINEIICAIKDHDVISFDLFDTLIERQIADPSDIFLILENYGKKRYNIDNFGILRKHIKNYINSESEEISLDERYDAIADRYNINKDICDDIKKYELNLEMRFLRLKKAGFNILSACKELNKRVILISDTYFSKDVISIFLKMFDLETLLDSIYLSSEIKKTKRTGNLFEYVKENEKTSRILHIGDDRYSDKKMAHKSGISSIILPKKEAFASSHSPLPSLTKMIPDNLTHSLLLGMMSHKISNHGGLKGGSFCHGSPEMLGYNILGPMFVAFSKWIHDKTKDHNIKDLFFLSRDGMIIKRVYDIMYPHEAHSSHYLYTSRRCSNVASIKGKDDIVSLIDAKFQKTRLNDLLHHKFGLSYEFINTLRVGDYGFLSNDEQVTYAENRDSILELLLSDNIFNEITRNAQFEKESLLDYLRKAGLTHDINPSEFCFIDIGHSGTIQSSLSSILKLDNTTGMYFVTDDKSKKVLESHTKHSYLASELKKEDKHHYTKSIQMYEFMFLNDEDSLIRFNGNVPEFVSLETDERRKALIRRIHSGIDEFARDMYYLMHDNLDMLKISDNDCDIFFRHFLESPSIYDVELFEGTHIENLFSGKKSRLVVSKNKKEGFWKKGSIVLKYPRVSQAVFLAKFFIIPKILLFFTKN